MNVTRIQPAPVEEPAYWVTPVKSSEVRSAEEDIRILVCENRIYALGEKTPNRKKIKPGDRICFY